MKVNLHLILRVFNCLSRDTCLLFNYYLQVAESKRLKALVSMAGPDIICVGAGRESQEVLKVHHCRFVFKVTIKLSLIALYIFILSVIQRIEREATYGYQTLTVPEDAAANVLYVNGTLIHRSEDEIPQSSKVFAEKIEFPTRSILTHV